MWKHTEATWSATSVQNDTNELVCCHGEAASLQNPKYMKIYSR